MFRSLYLVALWMSVFSLPVAAALPGSVLRVGPGMQYSKPSQAAAVAHDGDVVEIAAGTYTGDVAVWKANQLTLRGVGGTAILDAAGQAAEGKGIWIIRGNTTTVENIEFVGAKVSDKNGAGIRQEGRGLTVRHCIFRDNQDGLLAGNSPESVIDIEDSEFAHNGAGDGQSHNLYVGGVRELIVKNAYLHDAVVGHNLKSRAAFDSIVDSRFADEQTGNSSYALEFPNGGRVVLRSNVIQHGPKAENGTLVSYGAEGLQGDQNEFVATGNTFINQREAGGKFIFLAPGTQKIEIVGNVFSGRATLPDVPGIRDQNTVTSALPKNLSWRPGMPRE